MTGFRRHSIHRRRTKSGGSFYIIALLLLGGLMVWLLTMDLENSVALRWMTESEQPMTSETDIHIFPSGQFGVVVGDSTPTWIARQPQTIPLGDTSVFTATVLGKDFTWTLNEKQMPLWNDYVRHLRFWSQDCDSLFVVYGPVPDSAAIYTVNLCIDENSRGIGLVFPERISDFPFFNYAHAIDVVERMTGIDFYNDLLDPESEAYIEGHFQRFQWLYPDSLYHIRLLENKLYLDAHQ